MPLDLHDKDSYGALVFIHPSLQIHSLMQDSNDKNFVILQYLIKDNVLMGLNHAALQLSHHI